MSEILSAGIRYKISVNPRYKKPAGTIGVRAGGVGYYFFGAIGAIGANRFIQYFVEC